MSLRKEDGIRFAALVQAARRGTLMCFESTELEGGAPCAILAIEPPDGGLIPLALIPSRDIEEMVTAPTDTSESYRIDDDAKTREPGKADG